MYNDIKKLLKNKSIRQSGFKFLAILISLFSIILILEMIIWVFPIPSISNDKLSHYDSDIKLFTRKPGSTEFKWINQNKSRVYRTYNSDGYADVNHKLEKPKGVSRIAFFGDSFVESFQVPLDSTFFRIISNELGKKYEIFAYGIGGHGTLHSYLRMKKFVKNYDIDLAVYVFCNNDIGDNLEKYNPWPRLTFAERENDSLIINDSLQNSYFFKNKNFFSKNIFYNNSIVIKTLISRAYLFKKYFLKNRNKNNNKDNIIKVSQKTAPSLWPTSLKKEAEELAELNKKKMQNYITEFNKEFALFYVPRGRQDYLVTTAMSDTWKPWLEKYCKQNSINFLDPSSLFIKSEKKIYGDHFTENGHKVFAQYFLDWISSYRF